MRVFFAKKCIKKCTSRYDAEALQTEVASMMQCSMQVVGDVLCLCAVKVICQ